MVFESVSGIVHMFGPGFTSYSSLREACPPDVRPTPQTQVHNL
jgi:hypothetical protein